MDDKIIEIYDKLHLPVTLLYSMSVKNMILRCATFDRVEVYN